MVLAALYEFLACSDGIEARSVVVVSMDRGNAPMLGRLISRYGTWVLEPFRCSYACHFCANDSYTGGRRPGCGPLFSDTVQRHDPKLPF